MNYCIHCTYLDIDWCDLNKNKANKLKHCSAKELTREGLEKEGRDVSVYDRMYPENPFKGLDLSFSKRL